MATPKVTRRATSTYSGPSHQVAAASGERTRWRLGPEGQQGHVLEHEGHAEHQEDLHLVGRVHDAVDRARAARPAQDEQRGRAGDEAERYGIDRRRVASSQARYMPHTIMSPWAKLTTRMTPKIRVSPTAMRL